MHVGEMTCKSLPLCGRLRCLDMLFLGDVCRVGDEKKGKKKPDYLNGSHYSFNGESNSC
jgi:hypothetical protein